MNSGLRRWWDIHPPTLSDKQIEIETQRYRALHPVYDRFCKDVERLFLSLVEQAGIKVADSSSRPKDVEEFGHKCKRKNYLRPLDQMADLAGVRIVLYFASDAERVETIIRDTFNIDESESEDKHRTKKVDEFGYLSNHLVVTITSERAGLPEWQDFIDMKAEIQVRTLLEHSWAEVSHRLDYKKDKPLPESSQRDLARMMALLETVDKTFVDLRRVGDQFIETPDDLDESAVAADNSGA